jgi:hypothetical protein
MGMVSSRGVRARAAACTVNSALCGEYVWFGCTDHALAAYAAVKLKYHFCTATHVI